MENKMFYDFPKRSDCNHEKYLEGYCEWEISNKKHSNYIYECEKCGSFAETAVEIQSKKKR